MRRTFVIASVLTLFLFAGLAPTVMADPSSKDPQKPPAKEAKQECRDGCRLRFLESNTTLQLAGKGVGRDNVTYSFTIDAAGKGLWRLKDKGDDFTVFRGTLKAHGVVTAANGTVVKEGDFRVRLVARHTDEGWKWQLVSVGERPNGMPRLVLRGEAEKISPGAFDLAGKGHAVLRVDGKALPVKLSGVTGTFTRQLPPTAPSAPTAAA